MLRVINILVFPAILVIGLFIVISLSGSKRNDRSLAKEVKQEGIILKEYILDKDEYACYKSLKSIIREHSYQILPFVPLSKIVNKVDGEARRLIIDYLVTDYDFRPHLAIILLSNKDEISFLNNLFDEIGLEILLIDKNISEGELKNIIKEKLR